MSFHVALVLFFRRERPVTHEAVLYVRVGVHVLPVNVQDVLQGETPAAELANEGLFGGMSGHVIDQMRFPNERLPALLAAVAFVAHMALQMVIEAVLEVHYLAADVAHVGLSLVRRLYVFLETNLGYVTSAAPVTRQVPRRRVRLHVVVAVQLQLEGLAADAAPVGRRPLVVGGAVLNHRLLRVEVPLAQATAVAPYAAHYDLFHNYPGREVEESGRGPVLVKRLRMEVID